MASLDSILNVIIPTGVVIVFGFLFLRALREPLGALWSGIKRIFGVFKGKDDGFEDYNTLMYE